MRRTRLKNLKNSKVKNRAGVYTLYNKRGKPVYIGHSKILRHRLLSYVEKDDYKEHRTKRKLRKDAVSYTYNYKPIKQARKIEKKKKEKYKHNHG